MGLGPAVRVRSAVGGAAGITMTGALAAPVSAEPTPLIGYFAGLIAEPETVTGSTPSLAAISGKTQSVGGKNRGLDERDAFDEL